MLAVRSTSAGSLENTTAPCVLLCREKLLLIIPTTSVGGILDGPHKLMVTVTNAFGESSSTEITFTKEVSMSPVNSP
jgi:hypothetical protein